MKAIATPPPIPESEGEGRACPQCRSLNTKVETEGGEDLDARLVCLACGEIRWVYRTTEGGIAVRHTAEPEAQGLPREDTHTRSVLMAVVNAYPNIISTSEVCAAAQMDPSGTTARLLTLESRRLIVREQARPRQKGGSTWKASEYTLQKLGVE